MFGFLKTINKKRRVVITGVGPLTSVGIGQENLWNAILAKKTNVEKEEHSIDGKVLDSFYLHRVKDFSIESMGIDKEKLDLIRQWKNGEEDVDLNYLLAAIKLAFEDSKLKYDENSNNISFVIGHGNPGLEQFWEKNFNETYKIFHNNVNLDKQKYFDIYYKTFVKSSYDLQTYMYLFHIARTFQLHGLQLYLNNACSSGLYGLEVAREIIKQNQSDVVVIASAGRSRYYKYLWFKEAGYPYAKDGLVKPFDKNADGIVLGDGAAGIILEDMEHAISRKAKIYAEYLGGSFNSEAWKVTLPAVNEFHYKNVINNALATSNTRLDEIDLINPHGTGLTVVDKYEANAINAVFKNNKPLVTAFKPYIGHCIGGSALMEAVILLMSLQHGIVPATLNFKETNPKYNIDILKQHEKRALKKVMKICCAIAGFNAAVVFEKI